MSDPLAIAAKPAPGAVPVTAGGTGAASSEPVAAVTPAAAAVSETAPVSLEIGTTIGATLIAAAQGGPVVGSRFELRFGAAALSPGESSLAGTIAEGAAGDTIVESAMGALALDRRLSLAPGTTIAFQLSGTSEPSHAELPPSLANGWQALDQVLAALDKSAPGVAQQLRAALQPATAPALAATLLFMAGALYSGKWPGEPVARALNAMGHERLKARLDGDLGGLRSLGKDGMTGDWRVLTLPLLMGASVEPLRLYLRRKGGAAVQDPAGQRFILEAELSRLGALQLDGLVRETRLDLVLRSHVALPRELREEAAALFRRASAAAGYHGDIVFATAPSFAVDPMTELRGHVAVQI